MQTKLETLTTQAVRDARRDDAIYQECYQGFLDTLAQGNDAAHQAALKRDWAHVERLQRRALRTRRLADNLERTLRDFLTDVVSDAYRDDVVNDEKDEDY